MSSLPSESRGARWYWWPLRGLWHLVSRMEERLGIIRSLLIGAGLMILGLVFCLTFVGILIGFPTGLLGLFLVMRAIY